MKSLKKTILYENHVKLGANLAGFGGWEMPINYNSGIVGEHIHTRKKVGIFDVSHMGRFAISGVEGKKFLQYVLTNNVCDLDIMQSQYTMISNDAGVAIDDAYLYRFFKSEYLLVVNASNIDKDWEHLNKEIKKFDAKIMDKSEELAMISVQGPGSKRLLARLSNSPYFKDPARNSSELLSIKGEEIIVSMTGYTGEPLGFELFMKASKASSIWQCLLEQGATAIGLGARDTLRLEAGLPLYGHELGIDTHGTEIPIFSCPLAKSAVNFTVEKGSYIGKKSLIKQYEGFKKIKEKNFCDLSDLPKIIRPITLIDKGVARAGCKVFKDSCEVGYVTSATMVPYLKPEGNGLEGQITDNIALRAIGLALVDGDVELGENVEVEIRGRRVKATLPSYHLKRDVPPFTRPIVYGL